MTGADSRSPVRGCAVSKLTGDCQLGIVTGSIDDGLAVTLDVAVSAATQQQPAVGGGAQEL